MVSAAPSSSPLTDRISPRKSSLSRIFTEYSRGILPLQGKRTAYKLALEGSVGMKLNIALLVVVAIYLTAQAALLYLAAQKSLRQLRFTLPVPLHLLGLEGSDLG